jgi:hypothetical protein
MLCLVTDLLDWEEYPAPELAGLYKWRWDGSETGLREAKAPLHACLHHLQLERRRPAAWNSAAAG